MSLLIVVSSYPITLYLIKYLHCYDYDHVFTTCASVAVEVSNHVFIILSCALIRVQNY